MDLNNHKIQEAQGEHNPGFTDDADGPPPPYIIGLIQYNNSSRLFINENVLKLWKLCNFKNYFKKGDNKEVTVDQDPTTRPKILRYSFWLSVILKKLEPIIFI